MWLMTPNAFVWISRDDRGYVAKAHRQGDILNVFPDAKEVETDSAYPYSARLTDDEARQGMLSALSRVALDDLMKSGDKPHRAAYAEIWSLLTKRIGKLELPGLRPKTRWVNPTEIGLRDDPAIACFINGGLEPEDFE